MLLMLMAAAVAAAMSGGDTVASADRVVVASTEAPAGLAGYGEHLVWSQPAERGRSSSWELWGRSGGTSRRVPGVARRPSRAFDVDLGPGPDGKTVAVYTRDDQAFARTLGVRGRERVLRLALPRGTVPRYPAIWRNHIAVVARPRRGPDQLLEGPLRGRLRPVPRGSLTAFTDSIGGPRRRPARASSLDLRGRRLVFTWHRGRNTETEIVLDELPGRRRVLTRGLGDVGGEGVDFEGSPILDGPVVRWARWYELGIGAENACYCIVTFGPRTRRTRADGARAGRPYEIAATRRHLFLRSDDGIVRVRRPRSSAP